MGNNQNQTIVMFQSSYILCGIGKHSLLVCGWLIKDVTDNSHWFVVERFIGAMNLLLQTAISTILNYMKVGGESDANQISRKGSQLATSIRRF